MLHVSKIFVLPTDPLFVPVSIVLIMPLAVGEGLSTQLAIGTNVRWFQFGHSGANAT